LLRQDDPLNNIFGGQTIFLCVNYAQICVNGNTVVLKKIWNPIDFQDQRSRSPGQIDFD